MQRTSVRPTRSSIAPKNPRCFLAFINKVNSDIVMDRHHIEHVVKTHTFINYSKEYEAFKTVAKECIAETCEVYSK